MCMFSLRMVSGVNSEHSLREMHSAFPIAEEHPCKKCSLFRSVVVRSWSPFPRSPISAIAQGELLGVVKFTPSEPSINMSEYECLSKPPSPSPASSLYCVANTFHGTYRAIPSTGRVSSALLLARVLRKSSSRKKKKARALPAVIIRSHGLVHLGVGARGEPGHFFALSKFQWKYLTRQGTHLCR